MVGLPLADGGRERTMIAAQRRHGTTPANLSIARKLLLLLGRSAVGDLPGPSELDRGRSSCEPEKAGESRHHERDDDVPRVGSARRLAIERSARIRRPTNDRASSRRDDRSPRRDRSEPNGGTDGRPISRAAGSPRRAQGRFGRSPADAAGELRCALADGYSAPSTVSTVYQQSSDVVARALTPRAASDPSSRPAARGRRWVAPHRE